VRSSSGGEREDARVDQGKRWLLLSRWVNLTAGNRQEVSYVFALNRKVQGLPAQGEFGSAMDYHYEGAMQ